MEPINLEAERKFSQNGKRLILGRVEGGTFKQQTTTSWDRHAPRARNTDSLDLVV